MEEEFLCANGKKESEVIDHLLLAIQRIIAGKVNIFNNVRKDNCLQCQIQLSEKPPIIQLQYELVGDGLKLDYEQLAMKLFSKQCTWKEIFDVINFAVMDHFKQEFPEMLPVLCNSDAIAEEHSLEKQQTSISCSQKNKRNAETPCKKICLDLYSNDDNSRDKVVASIRNECFQPSASCLDLNTQANMVNENGKPIARSETFERNSETNSKAHQKSSYLFNYCEKSFSRRSDKTEHENIHISDSLFTCQECGITFTQSKSLHIHQRMHMREFHYSCKDCGKSFTYPSRFYRHQRIHWSKKSHS